MHNKANNKCLLSKHLLFYKNTQNTNKQSTDYQQNNTTNTQHFRLNLPYTFLEQTICKLFNNFCTFAVLFLGRKLNYSESMLHIRINLVWNSIFSA